MQALPRPRIANLVPTAIVVFLVALAFAGSFTVRLQRLETPVVVSFEPEMVRDVPVLSPLTFRFSTPMNRSSVEAAFKLTPEVPGKFAWEGNVFSFNPRAPGLKRGTMYTVSVDSTALNSQQQRLPSPFEASFLAANSLSVLNVQPFKDSTEVGSDAVISVQFSNPVASLTTLDTAQSDPLLITPTVEGRGKWLTTSIYTFHPKAGLTASTQYTVTVKKGIADTTGSALAADFVWSFRTWLPTVTSVYPAPNSRFVWITTPITATFNQPVDQASIQGKFHLTDPDGREIPGSVAWIDERTFAFTPKAQLSRATKYTATFDAGVRGANGNLGMPKEYVWQFSTIELPRLISANPLNGTRVNNYSSISLYFNQPMNPASVMEHLEIIPKPTRVYTYWSAGDTVVNISGVITRPSFRYRFVLNPGALDRYGQRLEEGKAVEFETQPIPPYARLKVPVGTVAASSTAANYAIVEAVNMQGEAQLSLHAVDRETFISLDSDNTQKRNLTPLRQWTVPIQGELDKQVTVTQTLSLDDGRPVLPPGLYALKVEPNNTPYYRPSLMVVSRMAVTLKLTTNEALVWVVDRATGEPVRDANVSLVDRYNATLGAGKTDANGLFLFQPGSGSLNKSLLAFAEKDGDTAVTGSEWANGISPYEFNLPYRMSGPNHAVALYTDRPIYRPGDKVYFKGVVRADDDGRYTPLPADSLAAVFIANSQSRAVYSATLPLNEFGSFYGEIALDEEAPTGYYSVRVTMLSAAELNVRGVPWPTIAASRQTSYPSDDPYYASFLVAEFRKPDYEVKLSTDKKEYVQADEVVVTVRAGYFFGAPLSDARVNWQVFQKPFYFAGPKDVVGGPYSFNDYQPRFYGPVLTPGPKPIASGEGKTDANGILTFRLRADIARETTGQTFTFEATVSDMNNQQVSGRSEAIVHKGTFYIGARTGRSVVTAGKPASVEVMTIDSRAITVPHKVVSLDLLEQKWFSVQEKDASGRFYWTSKVESTLVASATVTTDGAGHGNVPMTPPKAGSYKVLLTAVDERGNEIRSATSLYASGSEYVYWRMENHDRIELIADKTSYKPGETAKVLIASPFPRARGLLTIERGHIVDYKAFEVDSSTPTVEIPLDSTHLPNVFVSVVLFRGEAEGAGRADFKVGYVELPVETDEKKLTITITPDKARYQPRETVTYKIRTTDYLGKPVRAELSLALVDASVLSLAEERVREMFDSFYKRRSMSVRTAQTLIRAIEKYDPSYGSGKGGGGEPQDARGYFPDLAYWNPTLTTDGNGEATVSVPLPDSLTTWRLTVRGTTASTIVGTERNDIVVSKQVMVRPVVPRFLTIGDEARLEAIIHNYTAGPIEAEVTLAAKGVTIGSQSPQTVKVNPSSAAKVYWTARAGREEVATLTFEAQPLSPSGAPKDAIELSLPILTYSAPETTATSGEVRTTVTEAVYLPADINKELGELTIRMEPSLAASMQDGLKYLEHYPYECIEQTVSRFLPNILTLRALNRVGIDKPELRQQLPGLVSLAVQRLNRAQNPDGSWGWWPGDTGNPFITAYALYGLNEAKREGFAVPPEVIQKASTYLNGYLQSSRDVYDPMNANFRAYILYVLAETGRGDRGTTISLYERRDSVSASGSRIALGHYGRAYLAMALFILNDGKVDSRVQNLIEDLSSSAIASATGVHWEEGVYDYRTMNTNNRTTSIVLDALVRIDPTNPLIPGAVRWLMVSRKEGHWETTQETAMAVIALSDYLVMSGELNPSYNYDVAVNGKKLGGDAVSRANVNAQGNFAIEIPDLLIAEANKVRLSRYPSPGEQSVKGKLYYSLYLRYFLPVHNIAARDEGIVLSREYFDAGGQPVKGAAVGSTLKVKLTIVASQDLHYVVIEDPLPAGAEAVDSTLKTTSLTDRTSSSDPRRYYDTNRWRFNHIDIRDEKIALFATYLPRGTYEYTYLIRTTTAGTYQALPARAWQMYFPEVWGRSAGEVFTID